MTLPAPGYLESGTRTEGEMKAALEDLNKAIKQIPGAGQAKQALTISAGSVTPAVGLSQVLEIDTEAAAATDDLTNIVTTNLGANSLVLVKISNAGRVVTLKHASGGTGQMSLKTAGDFTLGDTSHWILFFANGAQLDEIERFPKAGPAVLTKSGSYTMAVADRGKLVDCTATLTLTLLSASVAGKGFEHGVQCSGGVATITGLLTLQRGDKVWIVSDGTAWQVVQRFSAQALPGHGHLWGLRLSNNGSDATNDLDCAVGEVMSDDADSADAVLLRLTSALTKQLDAAWAVGNNAGGRDTGSIADGTWHVFLIGRPDTGVVDKLYSLSVSSPTMPANYTKKRRIGSMLRESGAIVAFHQVGDIFWRKVYASDVAATNPGTSVVARTLSVPAGLELTALTVVTIRQDATNIYVRITPVAETDAAAVEGNSQISSWGSLNVTHAAQIPVLTTTGRQINSRISVSSSNVVLFILTAGWIDNRGRIA